MSASLAIALALLGLSTSQKNAETAKKPTELDRLVKTKSIDKLRAKFLQAPNDDVRDDVRAAIMTVVSEVHAEASMTHSKETESLKLDWPRHEHRGYVDLNKAKRETYKTLYGKHLARNVLETTNNPGPRTATFYQLIIVAGEIDSFLYLTDCVLICDSVTSSAHISESVVIASSDLMLGNFGSLAVSNGRVDMSYDTRDPIYTNGDIFITPFKLTAKEFVKKGLSCGTYYAEGKTPVTGLTFFRLADLGITCKLDADKAVVVESVKAGSAAEAGQLKVGDVLKLVNLRKVKTLGKTEELFRYAMMDGPKAKVAVTRGQESLDLEILFP